MNPARHHSVLLGVVSVVVGPGIGLSVMLAIWSVADTWGSGGIDFGVVAAGCAASAVTVALTGKLAGQPVRSLVPWIAAAFLAMALIAFLAIVGFMYLTQDFGRFD